MLRVPPVPRLFAVKPDLTLTLLFSPRLLFELFFWLDPELLSVVVSRGGILYGFSRGVSPMLSTVRRR